jgi:hypothetical protein
MAFVPELLIVACLMKATSVIFLLFILISLTVCYYNILLFKRFLQTKTYSTRVIYSTSAVYLVAFYGVSVSVLLLMWLSIL